MEFLQSQQVGFGRMLAMLSVLIAPAISSAAFIEDFSGPPAGTVVAGQLPGGGTAAGTTFAGFTLGVTNTGGGPQSLIIFDSSNPTGGDPDLGTPNQTCAGGGPGVGVGGQVGQPGENCVPQGNLLIIAEDIVDTSPVDGVVDDPDDEAGGGKVIFEFDDVVVVKFVTIIDIDNESAQFLLEKDGTLKGTVDATDLGDNSAQTLNLESYGAITCLELTFSSSGAIAEIIWELATVAVQEKSMTEIKTQYRE